MTHESSTLMGYAIMTPIFGQLRVNDERGTELTTYRSHGGDDS